MSAAHAKAHRRLPAGSQCMNTIQPRHEKTRHQTKVHQQLSVVRGRDDVQHVMEKPLPERIDVKITRSWMVKPVSASKARKVCARCLARRMDNEFAARSQNS